MAAALALVALSGGAVYLVSRLLPEVHPIRRRMDAAVLWIKQNPDLFEKRFKQIAFFLIVLVFVFITLVYS